MTTMTGVSTLPRDRALTRADLDRMPDVFTATAPYDVTIVPAALVSDHRRG